MTTKLNDPAALPSLAFVGPILPGSARSAHTQAHILAALFEQAGYRVFRFSTSMNRYWRPIDIAISLIRHRHEIDLALIQVYSGNSFRVIDLASQLCQWLGIYQVMSLHGGNLPVMMEVHPDWLQRVFQRADQIIANSPYLKQEMLQKGINCTIIFNVIDLESYPRRHLEHPRPNILWMRSFGEVYNPPMAVRVIAALRQEFPEARLLMAGPDHGLLKRTQEIAKQLNVHTTIEWLGYINHEQKIAAAQKADIYINTNSVDNMPVSLLEMAALGLPIVTTDAGGIPHLWQHNENCLMVSKGDVTAMTAAIKHLLQNPSLINRLTSNAYSLVSAMNWQNIQKNWENEVFSHFKEKSVG